MGGEGGTGAHEGWRATPPPLYKNKSPRTNIAGGDLYLWGGGGVPHSRPYPAHCHTRPSH